MKKSTVFLSICFVVFSGSAWAQPNYLIRIDQINQPIIDRVKDTAIEIYAKTADFWIADASEKQLKFLIEEGIAFLILDQDADIGEYYLVCSEPSGTIAVHLQEIEANSQILVSDQSATVVKGDPRKIEQLVSLGFDLAKINKKPLPLEPTTCIPAYLESLSPDYDPLIDSIVKKVDQAQLFSWIDDLTGEDTVLIGGMEDSIKTRYSWSHRVFKAADYIKEGFEKMGISVEFDTFQVGPRTAYLVDVACSPDGQEVWAVSIGGGIIKTTDGGDHWSLVEGTDNLTLWDICRVNDDTLWSVGRRGIIIVSTDGGDTWESRSKDEFSGLDFRGSYFEDADHGWVVGAEEVLYTSDGGTNWTEQAEVAGVGLYGVDFVDSLR
jgi:hypothetical protein